MNRLDLRYILCPVDFSPLSAASLATAGAIASARDAELRAVHVVPSEGATPPRGLGSLEQQTFMSRLRTTLSEVAPGDERTGGAVRHGDPAAQILQLARAMPADLTQSSAARSAPCS